MLRLLQRGLLLGCLIGLVAGVGALLPAPAAHAQARSKRLVLKDGSYQAASKWEIKGNRVRYFSSERYEWEELPTSLVDWPATEKYNASLSSVDTQTREADAEERAEREREAAATPAVAPGLLLPATGGVFMLDTWRGQPQLVEMGQSGADINKQTNRNILRAAINPLATARQSIELKGARATVQGHVPRPEIFANVDQSSPGAGVDAGGAVTSSPTNARDLDLEPNRYRIVRVQQKKDMRVVGNLKINMIGKVSEQQTEIQTVSRPLSGGWVRIVPTQDLTPGEYALVEMLGPGQMNLYVWDFGVNPSAPQNSSSWKPVQPAPTRTGSNESPVLNKRPKQ